MGGGGGGEGGGGIAFLATKINRITAKKDPERYWGKRIQPPLNVENSPEAFEILSDGKEAAGRRCKPESALL